MHASGMREMEWLRVDRKRDSAFDRLAAKILIGTNQKKDLRILKSGDLRQKPRKDLGNQSACPLEQLYSVCTPARVGIGADKLSLALKFSISERRGHTAAHMG